MATRIEFCFVPLAKIDDPDIDTAYSIDDSFCSDPFEERDGFIAESEHKIMLRKYSLLTESYYFVRSVAYSVKGLTGLYQRQDSVPF